ncbi:PIN domain-containing protein [Montanilutibacter psychrotolerans]|uniref:PIN domain-containing protein n=1 Tax=Montanilutibacter psychrotolerans TaxID=1327343 RepID=A0A3M8SSK6_9GAMM|nr:PIN domain-containing protein [Lysobacter psychrotolerans]RNF83675.1 PIN domain-containing protein [Lysobacter psychrotolerans]
MAGHARYTAVLDACVLYPACVADALMSMAVAGLYAAKWTTRIEQEWLRNLGRDRPEIAGKLVRRRDLMRQAIPDWEVPEAASDAVASGLALPDPGDVHVLAAAIAGHADCIVTANLKDFPANVLDVHGLSAIHPDDFLIAQFDLDSIAALAAFKEMRARSKSPPLTPEEFAGAFERNGLVAMAERLRVAAELI